MTARTYHPHPGTPLAEAATHVRRPDSPMRVLDHGQCCTKCGRAMEERVRVHRRCTVWTCPDGHMSRQLQWAGRVSP